MMDPDLIRAARGETQVDTLLVNGKVIDVLSCEIRDTPVAIYGDRIVGFDEYSASRTLDLGGMLIAPGLMDSHVHLESTMMTVGEFARAVVPRGITAVATDCHEIANVMGMEGIEYQLCCAEDVPLDVFVMLPPCVPASPLGTSGAILGDELFTLLDRPDVLGLGEMMNYPGVISCRGDVLHKIEMVGDRVVDGHAPGVRGRDLSAYIAAGIGSDHESTELEEAREKLEKGMRIFLRQGTAEKNLLDILPLVNRENSRRFQFCTDDLHPPDLMRYGGIDNMLRMSVDAGIDPLSAIQMATLNASEYFRLYDRGSISIGRLADLVVFGDLEGFQAEMVFKGGELVARGGRMEAEIPGPPIHLRPSFKVSGFSRDSLRVKATGKKLRVIGVVPGQVLTKSLVEEARVDGGEVASDPERDVLKIAVVERHHGTGNVGLAFVKGIGLKNGALASSVAHDAHNIVVVGVDDSDMVGAVEELISMEGGQVVWSEGKALARLPLPIAGLMSPESLEESAERVEALNAAAGQLGCTLDDPFMNLSFLALEVIPELKLTDKGLVDVDRFDFVDPVF